MPAAPSRAEHRLGRFQLLRLAHASQRTMAWRVADPQRQDRELLLVMPRRQPPDAAWRRRWFAHARRAAAISHPGLRRPIEMGESEHWPWLAYDLGATGATLAEQWPAAGRGVPPRSFIDAMAPALGGLQVAHAAGLPHGDLQGGLLWLTGGDEARAQWIGLGVAWESSGLPPPPAEADPTAKPQAGSVEEDVLALGLLLHRALSGNRPGDEEDALRLAGRLMAGGPAARVVLPGQPALPPPIRAIVDRATSTRATRRPQAVAEVAQALAGWRLADASADGVLEALGAQELSSRGLPLGRGAVRLVSRLGVMASRRHARELGRTVLEDPALAVEIMRRAQRAMDQGRFGGGQGPVLTMQRCIALLGLEGVRLAASALPVWPFDARPEAAAALEGELALAGVAGRLAGVLAPAGYDPQVLHLIALLQRLGWLTLHVQRPDEAATVRALRAAVRNEDDDPAAPLWVPGMTEAEATRAVFGFDADAVTAALAQRWRLEPSLQALMVRLDPAETVERPRDDAGWLRLAASAAWEAVLAGAEPGGLRQDALAKVMARHGALLGLGEGSLQAALLQAQARAPAAAPSHLASTQAQLDARRHDETVHRTDHG